MSTASPLEQPLEKRASGVLLHPTSLPSRWGVGDLGPAARGFATRLGAAGQRYWQILPLNPTTAAADDSPYFSNSSRAGNPLLISLEDLAEDGLLQPQQLQPPLAAAPGAADFACARQSKEPLLAEAAATAMRDRADDPDFAAFCTAEADWLDDHALFTALRREQDRSWLDWPEALKRRRPDALNQALLRLAAAIGREKWLQFFFQQQWQRLRTHCHEQGVWLFGDMPIYVNIDSADVWADPEVFKLDDELRPTAESGVPPDYFSATGQLWRNPVYDWQRLETDGFSWWKRRLATLMRRFDVLRIDHFRGLAQYWEVPAGSDTAIHGQWMDVPSYAFLEALHAAIDPLPVVAEDLGTITPDVHALRDHFGYPGMVILQFAFSGDPHNPYLPQHHRENAVAYLGTHDNNTTRGWLEEDLDDAARRHLLEYVALGDSAASVRGLIDLLLSSQARIAIVCAQDLLALPASARMNTPGVAAGNWRWQLTDEQFAALPLCWLREHCAMQNRIPGEPAH
jgi:4-alpha-glucanotransferase